MHYQLIKSIQEVFERHGIKESPLQIVLLAELKATQTLLMNLGAAGNDELFRLSEKSIQQDTAAALILLLDELYGKSVTGEIIGKHPDFSSN